MNDPLILVIEDEESIRGMLRMALEIAGFECIEADNIQSGYTMIVNKRPNLVLLDWMLPGGNGIELLRRLKREDNTKDLPVIMLTAKTTEDNMVQGLDIGADDYVTKPFAPRELIARIKALLRRTPGVLQDESIQVGQLILQGESKRVFLGEVILEMGPTEFNLLQFFMWHPERAFTRGQLLDRVWGANVYVEERTVDVHIRRLRIALQSASLDYSSVIETVRGTGYRFSSRSVVPATPKFESSSSPQPAHWR